MNRRRRSGVLVPLFSLTSTHSWGIGDFADLPLFAGWLLRAAQSVVQILPLSEMPEAETSPYSALTAMALDPIYISLPNVSDFVALGGEEALGESERATLARVRQAVTIAYPAVRELKERCLRRAHEQFAIVEAAHTTERARRFDAFVRDESSWLDDYALFQALRSAHQQKPWWEWPAALATRQPAALAQAHAEWQREIHYRKYAQWIAAQQWAEARRASQPLAIFGDLPFMISADSPDVWMRQSEFRFDATVGVPPDAFSATGQDWGLPPWRWEAFAANDYAWIRRRAARSAELFDGFRIDHLVGLYRTYIRPRDPAIAPFFAPADEPSQRRLGEAIVTIYQESGAEVLAEDLGVVPDFVRASLRRLGIPGLKVMRWERHYEQADRPFIDPADYPEVSVATTGTHDTESLVVWWTALSDIEKAQIEQLPSVRRYLRGGAPAIDALVRALLDAHSALAIVPVQDIFAWPNRINTPAEVSSANWSWILPWRVDRWEQDAAVAARADTLAAWTREAHRD